MTTGYVIDANILFGAFISGKDLYDLLFSELRIYVHESLLDGLVQQGYDQVMLLGDLIRQIQKHES